MQIRTAVGHLAKAYRMRALGVDGQEQRGADQLPYRGVVPLEEIEEVFFDAVASVREAVMALDGAYTGTKKHPALAVVRRPVQMRSVLRALHEAAVVLTAEMKAEQMEGADEFEALVDQTERLLSWLCRCPRPHPN